LVGRTSTLSGLSMATLVSGRLGLKTYTTSWDITTHGVPAAKPWSGGLMEVNGKEPDFDSSYILDRSFWRSLLQQHPEGVVVAVPKRGGLLYAPLGDQAAVAGVRKGVTFLYRSSGDLRVSSALYLFKNDRWSIFQPPVKH
jgi:hypothetical protein